MRIAFQAFPGQRWLGGLTTFEDLFVALRSLGTATPEIMLVFWEGTTEADYTTLLPHVTSTAAATYPAHMPELAAASAPSCMQRIARRLGLSARQPVSVPADSLTGALRGQGIDCLFSVVQEQRRDCSVPLLIWFYDFQHRHLPQFFSAAERSERDKTLTQEAQLARLIIVQSEAVAADARAFSPAHAHKVRRLPWVSHVPPAIYAQDPQTVLDRYHLPQKFFYLPNQFWQHKNHAIVFQALARLRERGILPYVVCTGSLYDSRNLEYAGRIMQALSEWELRNQVAILGVVPREHVYVLMRQAVRVINPSLFEGFGLSTAECKSLGKGLILSDLPVLHEQQAPDSLYFNPQRPEELADILEAVWRMSSPGPDLDLEAAARARLPARQHEFAEAFLALAKEAKSGGTT